MVSEKLGSGDPSATLWYLQNLELYKTVKPYFINVPASALEDGQQSNEISEAVGGITIRNMRSHEAASDFDLSGFTYVQHQFSGDADDFRNIDYVYDNYGQQVTDWLQQWTGAEAVRVVSAGVRKRDPDFPKRIWGSSGDNQPIQGVHGDFTPIAARRKFERVVGKKQAELWKNRRFQMLNIWRPLRGPVRDWPLAVVDARSVDMENDMIASDNILPHGATETWNVLYNKNHQWYYVADQMPDEVLIFKSFDSKPGVSNAVPHAAFDIKIEGAPRRESVEMMMLVVYPGGN